MPFVALSTGERTEQHIRRRFKEWFTKSGQTQKEAGKAIEWEQQTVSAYFRGEQQIDFVRAITWTKHFGYEIDDLLARSPKTKPENPKLQKWVNLFSSLDEEAQEHMMAMGQLAIGNRPKKAARGRRV